jgi:hypothetical protein
MTIGGSPVGYVHETVTRAAGAGGLLVRTESEMKMVLNRLGTKVELGLLSSTEESESGVLLRLVSELKASVLSTKTEASFRDGKIELRTESGGKTYSRTIDAPGDLLGPEGIRRLSLDKLKKAGDTVEYRTFEEELATVTKGTRRVLAREPLTVGGRTIETLKVEETIEAGGVTGTVWLDPEGEALRQVIPTPFGEGVVVLADRATALAAASGGELPPEMFERSIIRAGVRMPWAREINRLAVRLIARNPGMAWPEIRLPSQTARILPDGSLEIVIEKGPAPSQPSFPVQVTDATREFLEPNAYIQSDDAELKALAVKILAGEKKIFSAAVKLRRWVAENMTFDLGIAMAPSSEILRNRRGTCVGYATLLAALARAAGIPSRVVIGYVYALGMFGGHAWTEIMAGETWIPIDAALPSAGAADAARVGLLATSFRDGTGSLGAGAAYKIFGQVDMRILEYAVASKPSVGVPAGTAPYRVNGDGYENPWLGITFRKPEGFTFSKLDAVWPDPTVAAADGPNGVKIALWEAYLKPWLAPAESAAAVLAEFKKTPRQADWQGRPAFRVETEKRAAIIIFDAPEAWVLTAEGAGAPAVLDRLLSGFSIREPD